MLSQENKKLRKKIKQVRKWLKDSRKDYKKRVELKTMGTRTENFLNSFGTQTEDIGTSPAGTQIEETYIELFKFKQRIFVLIL